MSEIDPPRPPGPSGAGQATTTATGPDDTSLADFFRTDDDLPRRTGRTRHPRSVQPPVETLPFVERLLAPVTAVVVVIVVILLMIWINGSAPDTSHPSAAKRAAPTAPAPTHHGGTTPATPPAAVGPTHHAGGKKTRHHRTGGVTAKAALVVLNNSTRTGLAHAVAVQASRKGWHVSRVGNMSAVVAKTTVYYARGEHAAAVHLAHEFGSVQRVAPNRAGHLHGHGLTLVITRSWRL